MENWISSQTSWTHPCYNYCNRLWYILYTLSPSLQSCLTGLSIHSHGCVFCIYVYSSLTHTYTHTHTHTHTQPHTQTHKHTYTHMHARVVSELDDQDYGHLNHFLVGQVSLICKLICQDVNWILIHHIFIRKRHLWLISEWTLGLVNALNHHWCETSLLPQVVLKHVVSRDSILKNSVHDGTSSVPYGMF